MSEKLISHSPDLLKLREMGADLEARDGYLVLHSIPYVNAEGEIAYGAVVTDLQQSGDKTARPGDHQVWFTGSFPHYSAGKPIEPLRHTDKKQTLASGLIANHRFSCKPREGYPDYFEKMTRYVEIISNPARSIDPNVTPYPNKPIRASEDEKVFRYPDTASSRYGIAALSQKCAMGKVVIVGLGGTGSYILDFIAKTPIAEIHLIDGDQFGQHNAFRAPGAPSIEELETMPAKVDYFAGVYGKMRGGIHPHPVYLSEDTISLLDGADFVFFCVDKPAVRKLAFEYLLARDIPFIDTGMEMEYIEETACLIGDCRATLCTPDRNDHIPRRVSTGDAGADDLYDSNIQVADMNAMNALLAVMKWKKHCGFYQDIYKEHSTTYSINAHVLTRDEIEED